MSRWRTAGPVAGVLILVALAIVLGGDAFIAGVRALTPGTIAAGMGVAAVTTVASAWRWQVVAGALGLELRLSTAVAAYYSSQFLNSTLPGGVLGDLRRGVRHGRSAGDLAVGLRAVLWERAFGQGALILVAGVATVLLRPFGSLGAALVAVGGFVVVLGFLARRWSSSIAGDTRRLASPATLARVCAASLVVLCGHLATFALAVHSVGVGMPSAQLVPLALVVLVVAAVPLNLAGWGPREGGAAWAFGAVGATAAQGVATATAFGLIVLAGVLPGAVLVLVRGRHTGTSVTDRTRPGGDGAWSIGPMRS